MPTYDYRCKFCEHELEVFQGLSEKKLRKCPGCGRAGLQRLIGSGGGIVFKGSGFYETDYRSSGYKADAKADSKPDSKPDSKKDGGESGSGGSSKTSDSGGKAGSGGAKDKGAAPGPKAGGGSADKGKS